MTAFLNLCLPVFGADSAATALAWPSIPFILSLFFENLFAAKERKQHRDRSLSSFPVRNAKNPLTTPSKTGTLSAWTDVVL